MIRRRLVVGSGNAHKVSELRAMLTEAGLPLEVVGLADLSHAAPEIDESASTFAGNARLKADGFAAWLSEIGESGESWVLTDDSGISVEALDGAPGVHSARFAGPRATDADNNAKLVRELRARGLEQSPAHYSCVLVLRRVDGEADVGGETHVEVEAQWPVTVKVTARGEGGFGYDPHAWLGPGETVAELSQPTKAQQSHRAQALAALIARWPGRPHG